MNVTLAQCFHHLNSSSLPQLQVPKDQLAERERISECLLLSLVHVAKPCQDFNFWPTNGFSIKPLKVKLFSRGAESNRALVCHFAENEE